MWYARPTAQWRLALAVSATVRAVPLTAGLHDVPAEHDGTIAFTFEVRFSEGFKLR